MSRRDVAVPTRVLLGSFSTDGADRLHDLMRAARSGDPEAWSEVLGRVLDGASRAWAHVADGLVIPVPGHVPGETPRLVQVAAQAIAGARRWTYAADALRRRSASPEAKTGGVRNPDHEVSTLSWMGPDDGRVIVLVDDIVRSGITLRVCVETIRRAGDRRRVVAIALAEAIVGG